MKTILVITIIGFLACGESNPDIKAVGGSGSEILNSKYVRLVNDTNTLMLIENVVISYGDLYAEADSALYEKLKQTITVYGIKKASFKDDDISSNSYKTFIRYKKGEPRFHTD